MLVTMSDMITMGAQFFVHEHAGRSSNVAGCAIVVMWMLIDYAGNYVVVRETGVQIFEEMPIYARIGMHLLFYGSWQVWVVYIARCVHF